MIKKIIIILIVLGVLGTGFYLYEKSKNTVTVDPNTGEVVQGGVNFKDFFPFPKGTKVETPTTPSDGPVITGKPTTPEIPKEKPKLRKITDMHVAGFTTFNKEVTPAVYEDEVKVIKGKKTITKKLVTPAVYETGVRFVEASTGHVHETLVDKINVTETSLTTIPKVYESPFVGPLSIVYRYLGDDTKTITSYLGNIVKDTENSTDEQTLQKLTGNFLPDNITTLAVSPDGTKIFYIYPFGTGVVGINQNVATGKKTQIFTSPFHEWVAGWPNDKTVTVTTKPSARAQGFMYSIDSSLGGMNKVLGGVLGLTTLTSPNGTTVLVGGSSSGSINTSFFNTKTGDSVRLPGNTLPEKCVWGLASIAVYCGIPSNLASGDYPDTWYQGEVSFNDTLWQIDYSGNGKMLIDPSSLGINIDAINLQLDKENKNLFFINKIDSSLWEYEL